MPRLQCGPQVRLTLGFFVAAQSLFGLGCSQQDLTQYRPAGKLTASSDSKKSSDLEQSNEPVTSASPTVATNTAGESPRENQDSGAAPNLVAVAGPSNSDDDVSASALVPVNVVDGANVRSLLKVPSTETSSTTSSNTIEPTAAIAAVPQASSEPRQVEVLIKDKTFRTDQKFGALRASFDDLDLLKVLNMEPVSDNATDLMPAWLKGLNGKRVCIRGFMYPTYDTEGIEQFVLARDNQICCFGRDPKIYDLIQVDMKVGKSTNYIPATRSFDVVGTFHIDMKSDDGKPYGLYIIDDATVIDR